jgi:hypothetical protein
MFYAFPTSDCWQNSKSGIQDKQQFSRYPFTPARLALALKDENAHNILDLSACISIPGI